MVCGCAVQSEWITYKYIYIIAGESYLKHKDCCGMHWASSMFVRCRSNRLGIHRTGRLLRYRSSGHSCCVWRHQKWDIIVIPTGVQNQSNISSGCGFGIALILMRILSRCHSICIQCMHWNRFRIARRWFLAVYFMHMLTQRWIMTRNANRAISFNIFFSLLLLFFVESERDFYSVRQLKVCPNH